MENFIPYRDKKILNGVIVDQEMGDTISTIIGRNSVCAAIRLIDMGLLAEVGRLDLGKKTPFLIKVSLVDKEEAMRAITSRVL